MRRGKVSNRVRIIDTLHEVHMTVIKEGLGWKERGGNGGSSGVSNQREKLPSLSEARTEGFNRKKFMLRWSVKGIHKEMQIFIIVNGRRR